MKLFKRPTMVRVGKYYAIEKVFFGFKFYLDLRHGFWWARESGWFPDCISENFEAVENTYHKYYAETQEI